jgi:hypothetical protein
MKPAICLLAMGLLLGGQCDTPRAVAPPGLQVFSGMCDASAGVALDDDLFAAASDEDSVLRIFSRSRPGGPLSTADFAAQLGVKRRSTETDLEGAARVGEVVYWITSHGRNATGKPAPNRRRLIATRPVFRDGTIEWLPVGQPYRWLVEALDRDPRYAPLGLATAAERAPKEPGALNIEGLCDDGAGGLWIGFRNPIPGGRALLAGLRNPEEVVQGAPPRFGDPALLDVGGLGVRDLARVGERTLILAGPSEVSGPFRFYEWRGRESAPLRLVAGEWGNLKPEALVVFPGSGGADLLVLSDDGSFKIGGVEAKKLRDPNQQRFRAVRFGL